MESPTLGKEVNIGDVPNLRSLKILCAALSQPNPSVFSFYAFLANHDHNIECMEVTECFSPTLRISHGVETPEKVIKTGSNDKTEKEESVEASCQYVFASTSNATYLVYYLEGTYSDEEIEDLLCTVPTSQIKGFLERWKGTLWKSIFVTVLIDESFSPSTSYARIVDGIIARLFLGLNWNDLSIYHYEPNDFFSMPGSSDHPER